MYLVSCVSCPALFSETTSFSNTSNELLLRLTCVRLPTWVHFQIGRLMTVESGEGVGAEPLLRYFNFYRAACNADAV